MNKVLSMMILIMPFYPYESKMIPTFYLMIILNINSYKLILIFFKLKIYFKLF